MGAPPGFPVDLGSPATGGSLFDLFLNFFEPSEQPTAAPGLSWNDVISGPAVQGTAALAAVAQGFASPLQEPLALPNISSCTPDAGKRVFATSYKFLRDLGCPSIIAWLLGGLPGVVVIIICDLLGVLLWIIKTAVPIVASIGLDFIDATRRAIDPQVANIAVLVLNELLGTEYSALHLPTGDDVASHRGRAKDIGQLYINSIMANITPTTSLEDLKGFEGVAQFTGYIVNFGVATALLGLAGELGSLGYFKDFRLIGEQVSSGLGLSKQMRIAIKPLLKTLVATPFQWFLNERFFPQRFSLNEVVNPFQSTVMDHATIVKDLALQGWSPDRSEQLIKLHQKRLSVDEVETLRRWGHWSDDVATKYVTDLGWPSDLVSTLMVLPELKRIDTRMGKLVDALEANVVEGHMTLDDFVAFIKTLPFTDDERGVIQATVQAKIKAPHKSLTLGELQTALEVGFITLEDFDTFTTAMGYTSEQQLLLDQLTLEKIAQFEEAKAVAQFAYDAKVAAAQKKGAPLPPKPKILVG